MTLILRHWRPIYVITEDKIFPASEGINYQKLYIGDPVADAENAHKSVSDVMPGQQFVPGIVLRDQIQFPAPTSAQARLHLPHKKQVQAPSRMLSGIVFSQ
jgi:hypothetical protein